MPGDSGVLVVTRVRSITAIAHEAAGAAGIRHSPRPRLGREINQRLGRFAPRARSCMWTSCGFAVIARSDLSAEVQQEKAESDEAIRLSTSRRRRWIASLALAMTQNSLRPRGLETESEIRTSIRAEAFSSPPCVPLSLRERAIAGLDFPSRHLDRLVVVGESCLLVLLSSIGGAAEAIGIGVVGLDLDLSGKIGDRAIKIALVRVLLSPPLIGAGVPWFGLDPGREVSDGAPLVASGPVDDSPDPVSVGGSRVDFERLALVCQGMFFVAVPQIGFSAKRVSKCASRIDLDPAAVIGEGMAIVAPERKRHAANAVAVEAALGLDVDRLAEVGMGGARLASLRMQDPARHEAPGVLRVDLDRPGRISDRCVQIALVAAGDAAVAVGRRVVRIELDGLAVVGERLIVLALVAMGRAACPIRCGEVRIDLDRLVRVSNGFVEIALPPMRRSAKSVGD